MPGAPLSPTVAVGAMGVAVAEQKPGDCNLTPCKLQAVCGPPVEQLCRSLWSYPDSLQRSLASVFPTHLSQLRCKCILMVLKMCAKKSDHCR